ncbi:hypothetical protein QOZ98_000917 [Planomicrobium stackebrandtii]|uniref:Uncharacterized protein n=1 Tax=Planomicrobium stackebrandtii TaxID=253160 RepID=A0ABU0GTJ5_9BACL|nr:hypothetical protein [Planomicrobium stackebrandtii]
MVHTVFWERVWIIKTDKKTGVHFEFPVFLCCSIKILKDFILLKQK